MNNQLGETIKNTRTSQHLSQKELSQDICSQPMLSSIEHGKYMPNAKLLILLCERLNISIATISLSTNYHISDNQKLNNQLSILCNNHHYQQLLDFLNNDDTLDLINSDLQTQAYYYYLGIAKIQTGVDHNEALNSFKLSLSSHENSTDSNTLTRLTHASIAVIKSISHQPNSVDEEIMLATNKIETINYTENLNIIPYLSACAAAKSSNWTTAVHWINLGITFTTEHNSHYMLANYYFLLAHVSAVTDEQNIKIESEQRSKIFSDLFNEKVFKQF